MSHHLGTKQLNLHNPSPHIGGGQGIFQGGWRGVKHFSSWKLNDEHNLTVLVRGGRHFFHLPGRGSEAKSKPMMDIPEEGFSRSIAWSLIIIVMKYEQEIKSNQLIRYFFKSIFLNLKSKK